ncbi:MAG TPA: hypothetical protein VGS05_14075 [Candidatus Sulfotelmatobacter sp.]|nr:hypothetical protein [Candidatus Sulfotelmatobacter sp.]
MRATGLCSILLLAVPVVAQSKYIVQTNDGRSFRIKEIGNVKGIKSENAALLDWVRDLIQIANSPQSR